jgi:hypothetical protein
MRESEALPFPKLGFWHIAQGDRTVMRLRQIAQPTASIDLVQERIGHSDTQWKKLNSPKLELRAWY